MFTITFTLWLSFALAVVEAAHLQPRKEGNSFTVQTIRQSTGQLPDGYAAKEKAFLKYGWPISAVTPSSILRRTTTDLNGTVTATGEEYDAAYPGPVTIGGQTLQLDFDTGSSDLWIFSTSLPAASRQGRRVYDPNESKTYVNKSKQSWNISYGDGSGASGFVGADTVDVGGIMLRGQAVEVATDVSEEFIENIYSDGILGLAFKKLNTVRPTQQTPFFGNIKASLTHPIFTADLRTDGTGTYDFGFVNASKYKGAITHVNINTTLGFWQFASPTFEIGGVSYANTGVVPAIADTGTSLMLVDDTVAYEYWSAVPNAIYDEGSYLFPCTQTLPSFGVAIGRTGKIVTVAGSLLNYAPVGHGYCYGGVQENGGNIFQVYGDLMFRSCFVVFYGGAANLGLGIAEKSGA